MTRKEALQASNRADFVDLNGRIMRTCNVLKPSERTLNSVYTLCKCDYAAQKIEQSMEYLCDSCYLKIEHPKGIECMSEYGEDSLGRVTIRITAKGMQLLMGVIQDACVEI